MQVTLTRITEDPVLAIEEAASNCYDSEPSTDGKIMNHCIRSGHTSVTEFCNFNFHITGVSRALLAQLTRHRHAGYAVRSQRYCSEDGFEYVIPATIKHNEVAKQHFIEAMTYLNQTYGLLQELDVPNEDARYVLPNACYTTIEMTINLRSLMNFMNERLCTRSQWEIRRLALAMRDEIIKQAPQFEPYLVPKCEKYGKNKAFCPESKRQSCGKHPRLVELFDQIKQ